MGVSERLSHQLPSGFWVSRMRTRAANLRMFLLSRAMGTCRISFFSQKRMGRLPLARRNSIALAVLNLIVVDVRWPIAKKLGPKKWAVRSLRQRKQYPTGLWVQTYPRAQSYIVFQNGGFCQFLWLLKMRRGWETEKTGLICGNRLISIGLPFEN